MRKRFWIKYSVGGILVGIASAAVCDPHRLAGFLLGIFLCLLWYWLCLIQEKRKERIEHGTLAAKLTSLRHELRYKGML